MSEDQRKSARKVLKTKALFVKEGEAPLAGRTGDVSVNGVSINLPRPVAVGEEGYVRFDILVDGTFIPISGRAKVMYCIFSNNEFKIGFQFVKLEVSATTALSRFLR